MVTRDARHPSSTLLLFLFLLFLMFGVPVALAADVTGEDGFRSGEERDRGQVRKRSVG